MGEVLAAPEAMDEPRRLAITDGAGLLFAAAAALVLVILWRRGALRDSRGAGALTRSGGTKTSAWLGCAVITWLASAVAGSAAYGIAREWGGASELTAGGAAFCLACVVGVGAGVACERVCGAPGWGRARWEDAARGFGVFLLALPVVWAVNDVSRLLDRALTGSVPEPVAHETLRMMLESAWSGGFWLSVGAVVIAAPALEELIYRRQMQTALVRATGSDWAGIVGASLVFTLMHAGAASWSALPGLFALSLALGLAMERTGRVWVPIAAHSAFNAWNTALAMWLA